MSDYFSHLRTPPPEPRLTNKDKAERWTLENPKGWAAFHQFALDIKRGGIDRIGFDTIRGRVRWEVSFVRKEQFKISNSYSPILARMLMEQNPELEGLFELKQANLA